VVAGRVSIYLGSSWLKLSNNIGVYMVSTESWDTPQNLGIWNFSVWVRNFVIKELQFHQVRFLFFDPRPF
jgi:hypothetical protein